jgi:hypothetical protein
MIFKVQLIKIATALTDCGLNFSQIRLQPDRYRRLILASKPPLTNNNAVHTSIVSDKGKAHIEILVRFEGRTQVVNR